MCSVKKVFQGLRFASKRVYVSTYGLINLGVRHIETGTSSKNTRTLRVYHKTNFFDFRFFQTWNFKLAFNDISFYLSQVVNYLLKLFEKKLSWEMDL